MSYEKSIDKFAEIMDMLEKGLIKKEDLGKYQHWYETYKVVKSIYAVKDIMQNKKGFQPMKGNKALPNRSQRNVNSGNQKKGRFRYTKDDYKGNVKI